jgi:hypothetical protein
MTKAISVLPPGTEVILAEDVTGTIRAIRLVGKPLQVEYEVAWWSGGNRMEGFLQEFELAADDSRRVPIGFRG